MQTKHIFQLFAVLFTTICLTPAYGDECYDVLSGTVCCAAGQEFCGCTDIRAFCAGDVWGAPAGSYDLFGVCYDPTVYTCTYQPDPNYWVLCPNSNTTVCVNPDANLLVEPICCANADTCQLVMAADPTTAESTLRCVPPTSAPLPCGTINCLLPGDMCCDDDLTGYRCYDPTNYICAANPLGNTLLCPAGTRACGSDCYEESQYCCGSTGIQQRALCPQGQI